MKIFGELGQGDKMNFKQFLRQTIGKNDIVLDIGSGNRTYHDVPCKKIYGIDAWRKVKPDFLIDLEVESLPFDENTFDSIMMVDFIEHVSKEAGLRIIEECKKITKNRIILQTPLWWDDNSKNTENPSLWCYGNKYNYHKSLWEVDDFKGWNRILGIDNLENYFVGVWEK